MNRIVLINRTLVRMNHSMLHKFIKCIFWSFEAKDIGFKIHVKIHMSAGDKMAPFLASEMAWVCSTRSTKSMSRLLTTAN